MTSRAGASRVGIVVFLRSRDTAMSDVQQHDIAPEQPGSHSDRRADYGTDYDRDQERHHVADPREPAIETEAPEQHRSDHGFERVSDRDSRGDRKRLLCGGIGEKCSDENSGNASAAEKKHGSESEPGGRPDRRDLRSLEGQRQTELGASDVDQSDSNDHEQVGRPPAFHDPTSLRCVAPAASPAGPPPARRRTPTECRTQNEELRRGREAVFLHSAFCVLIHVFPGGRRAAGETAGQRPAPPH